MIDQLQNLYFSQEEPNKSCLLALREIILAHNESLSETVKYGMPCFCYEGKMLCYLWTNKKTSFPYILFVDGNFIEHDSLEQGNRARMKVLNVNPNKDIEVDLIKDILNLAIEVRKSGIAKWKKR